MTSTKPTTQKLKEQLNALQLCAQKGKVLLKKATELLEKIQNDKRLAKELEK